METKNRQRVKGRNYRRKTSEYSDECEDNSTSSATQIAGNPVVKSEDEAIEIDWSSLREEETNDATMNLTSITTPPTSSTGVQEDAPSDQQGEEQDQEDVKGEESRLADEARRLVPTAAHKIRGGVGFKLLKSMGWSEEQGLGPSLAGPAEPIPLLLKRDGFGVGFTEEMARSAEGAELRAVQDERRRRREEKQAERRAKEEAEDRARRAAEAVEKAKKKPQLLDLNAISYETLVKSKAVSVPTSSANPYNYTPRLVDEQPATSGPSSSASGMQRPAVKGPTDCPYCSATFASKLPLKDHVRHKHGDMLHQVRLTQRINSGADLKHHKKGRHKRQAANGSKKGLRGMIERQDFSY